MIVTTEQQALIFAEIDKLIALENEPEENEFTVQEYANHADRSSEWARKTLSALEERGAVKCRIYKNKKYYHLMDKRNCPEIPDN